MAHKQCVCVLFLALNKVTVLNVAGDHGYIINKH